MSEKKRMTLLLGVVVVLIMANAVVHLTGDSQGLVFFNGGEDLEDSWSASLKHKMAQLETLPVISLQPRARNQTDESDQQRNPFMFGVDRRREQLHRDRMAALAEARRQEQVQAEPQPQPEPTKPTFPGVLLGLMRNRNNGETRVSLSFEDEIHVVAEGEAFAGRYRLDKIGRTSIRLIQIADNEVIEVPIESR